MNKIIWIAGMPRSGTNWIGQIFASHPSVRYKLCPLFSYDFKDALDEHSNAAEWTTLLQATYDTRSEYLDQEYLRRDTLVPCFAEREAAPPVLAIKSTRYHHLLPRLLELVPHAQVVGIVRDPRAAIHSWLSNPLEFPADADPATEWRSGRCRKTAIGEYWGFDDWKTVATLYLDLARRHPGRFHLVQYEQWVQAPLACVSRSFDALELDLHPQTEAFLRESQSRHTEHPRAVFKHPSVASRWTETLAPAIAQTIAAELEGTPLAGFLVSHAPRP
ncbi:sulfotransferase family protein [Thauera sp. Sel9]|uniref:sulfotransferase family protein n=1 Tax=Thauera sp. Sel9 TaxID=2974299 RepID=UPI0021E10F8D|nr:sulfotransferase [Thauera sp. Sel9]MCV2216442.1 sulfotransferase [Thauera sp. Sel9]